jgi:hypothetical protein
MTNSGVPVIEQFLSGSPDGPISMDEMADADLEGEASAPDEAIA